MSEMDRMKDGEELAKLASKLGIGSKQLRNLYILAKSREIPFVEANVKYQMMRIKGYWSFGQEILKMLDKYSKDKAAFVDVLRYMNMLVDYYKAEPIMSIKPKVDEYLKTKLRPYGYQGISGFDVEHGILKLSVRLSSFRDNPQRLAQELEQELRSKIPEMQETDLRVWIDLPHRR